MDMPVQECHKRASPWPEVHHVVGICWPSHQCPPLIVGLCSQESYLSLSHSTQDFPLHSMSTRSSFSLKFMIDKRSTCLSQVFLSHAKRDLPSAKNCTFEVDNYVSCVVAAVEKG